MKQERLLELAGVRLINEAADVNAVVSQHIRDILNKTINTDSHFKDMSKEQLADEIEEMVAEQFGVLRDDLAKTIGDNLKKEWAA